MLDLSKMRGLAARPAAPGPTTRPARLNDADIGALFEYEDTSSLSLIDRGLKLFVRWIGE
jgi:hypothetical protein